MAVNCGSCKRDITGRQIDLALEITWADERDHSGPWNGVKSFCSFSCVASWAFEKAAQHDATTVISPPASFEPAEPVVDQRTETLIR